MSALLVYWSGRLAIAAVLAFIAWKIFQALDRVNREQERILDRLDENRAGPRKLVHLTGSPRVALVVDGPLVGMIHELYGAHRPDVIAFPIAEGDPTRHFYRLDADGGLRYLRTEPKETV